MRRASTIVLLAVAALLAGCNSEPDFDERYDSASRTIVDKAKAIDAEIASTGAPPPLDEPVAR
ncbi:MAG TPA: hypothetical protein VMQ93_10965 [Novosphingobium sp.]|nr:hypothetical protein [Novosphingobium sp.]